MPKISVVIPTYNSARFLGEAVRSVLEQTFQDFGIIVVDDGSTDNSKAAVDSFADLRIRYIYQENRGVSAARNAGIAVSQGKYIAFLDSDDIMLKDALKEGVEVLDAHPEVGFSYGQASITDETGRIYRTQKSSFLKSSSIVDSEAQVKELLFCCRITTSTVIVRRSCFETIGRFCDGLNYAEDRHLFIRLAKRWPVAYIAEPLVRYRVHSSQLHRHVDPKVVERAILLILSEVFDDHEIVTHFQPLKRRAYSNSYFRIAAYAYGQDMEMSRHYLRKAVRTYPRVLLGGNGVSIVYIYARSLLPEKIWRFARDLKRRFSTPKIYRS